MKHIGMILFSVVISNQSSHTPRLPANKAVDSTLIFKSQLEEKKRIRTFINCIFAKLKARQVFHTRLFEPVNFIIPNSLVFISFTSLILDIQTHTLNVRMLQQIFKICYKNVNIAYLSQYICFCPLLPDFYKNAITVVIEENDFIFMTC